MLIDREKFLVFAAAIAACQPLVNEPAASPAPLVPTAVASVSAPSPKPASAPSMCAEIVQGNEALLSRPTGGCPTREDAVEDARKQLLDPAHGKLFHYCHDGHGTWAVLVVSAALSESTGESGVACGSEVAYQLVFVSANGERFLSATRSSITFADMTREASIDAVFDFDGDGRDEIVVQNSSWANGGGSQSNLEVLHATSAIEPYRVGYPIGAVLDADDDGRPDFLNGEFFSVPMTCGLYETYRLGVPLLVHSLADGSFSMNDETARMWARRQCPSAPPETRSSDATIATCKRLWGQSVAQITRGLSTQPDGCSNAGSESALTKVLVQPAPPFVTLDVRTPAPLPEKHAPAP